MTHGPHERIRSTGDQSVYLVDFDVEHNVFLAMRGGGLWAYRYKNIPVGTKSKPK